MMRIQDCTQRKRKERTSVCSSVMGGLAAKCPASSKGPLWDHTSGMEPRTWIRMDGRYEMPRHHMYMRRNFFCTNVHLSACTVRIDG